MPPAFRTVNYNLRPAKHIERKMMVEALRRLSEFGSLSSYLYVGFGSIYFADFSLFHKALGISRMISIEETVGSKPRFEFNKPFKCIEVQYGPSSDELPKISFDPRSIVWLDYECKLKASVLTDIAFTCTALPAGSVLVVTVEAEPESEAQDPVKALAERVGEQRVPAGTMNRDVNASNLPVTYRRIISTQIEASLNARNGARPAGGKLRFDQLFFFKYRDTARMVTVGGLLYDEGQAAQVARCSFDSLVFTRRAAEPYEIDVPGLTYRELRRLDRSLPCADPAAITDPPVPSADVRRYAEYYRYFPTFADADV